MANRAAVSLISSETTGPLVAPRGVSSGAPRRTSACLARVCREGGARVKTNALVRELNVPHVRPEDGRRIEVIAEGTPLYGGPQVAIDATLVCPLSRSGEPKFNSHAVDGAALKERTKDKETKDCADVVASHRCRFLTAGMAVGGRWSHQLVGFVRALAKSRAADTPPHVRTAAQQMWYRRWTVMLAVAAQVAYAEPVLRDTLALSPVLGGDTPHLSSLVDDV